jgi:hypothetical protein
VKEPLDTVLFHLNICAALEPFNDDAAASIPFEVAPPSAEHLFVPWRDIWSIPSCQVGEPVCIGVDVSNT